MDYHTYKYAKNMADTIAEALRMMKADRSKLQSQIDQLDQQIVAAGTTMGMIYDNLPADPPKNVVQNKISDLIASLKTTD